MLNFSSQFWERKYSFGRLDPAGFFHQNLGDGRKRPDLTTIRSFGFSIRLAGQRLRCSTPLKDRLSFSTLCGFHMPKLSQIGWHLGVVFGRSRSAFCPNKWFQCLFEIRGLFWGIVFIWSRTHQSLPSIASSPKCDSNRPTDRNLGQRRHLIYHCITNQS